jgi:cytochrome b-561
LNDADKEMTRRDGVQSLVANVYEFPVNVWRAVVRHGAPGSPRTRSQTVTSNLFLHIHSARTHRWTLKKTFTFGLGIASVVSFIILAVTGILLMVYYKPTTAEAYNSIKDIYYIVPGGRLLRNIHRWATNVMIVSVVLHLMRVFYTASYKAPREFNWLVGTGLFVVVLALSFTGYCLPWDQLSYWAVVIGTNISGSMSEISHALGLGNLSGWTLLPRRILLGSDIIGDDALLRFYWLHSIALPITAAVLMAVHFWRIRKDGGMSRPEHITVEELAGTPEDDASGFDQVKTVGLMAVVKGRSPHTKSSPENTVLSFPHTFRAEMVISVMVLALLLVLAIFIDAPLKEAANPAVPENPAKAPWYFLGLQEIVSYSAFAGGMAIPILSVLGLGMIPFLDREQSESGRWPDKREWKWAGLSAAFTFVSIVSLLAVQVNKGWLRDWFPDINQLWIVAVNPGTIIFGLMCTFSVAATHISKSTRIGAVSFFTALMVFYIVFTWFGTFHRGPNWDFYWWPTLWPEH